MANIVKEGLICFTTHLKKNNILTKAQLKNAFAKGVAFNTELHLRKINVPIVSITELLESIHSSPWTHLLLPIYGIYTISEYVFIAICVNIFFLILSGSQ